MAQLAEYSLHKHEDPSLNSNTNIKAHTCNHSTGEAKTGKSLEFAGLI